MVVYAVLRHTIEGCVMRRCIQYVLAGVLLIASIPLCTLAGIAFSAYYDSVLPLWGGIGVGMVLFLTACSLFEIINKKPVKAQRIRWINSLAPDEYGVVIREYEDKVLGAFALNEPHLEIKMDDGRIIRFPKGLFVLCGDGVLEYKY
jgi:hypothetical protein